MGKTHVSLISYGFRQRVKHYKFKHVVGGCLSFGVRGGGGGSAVALVLLEFAHGCDGIGVG